MTRHAASLAWPVPEGNLIEGGLARLIGSMFKKGCVMCITAVNFSSTEIVRFLMDMVGAVELSCIDPCHPSVFLFSKGCYLRGVGNSIRYMFMCKWDTPRKTVPPTQFSNISRPFLSRNEYL